MSLHSPDESVKITANGAPSHSPTHTFREGGEGVFVQLAFMFAVLGYQLVVSLLKFTGSGGDAEPGHAQTGIGGESPISSSPHLG